MERLALVTGISDWTHDVDINECTDNTAQCDPNASCNNNDGGYTCTCKTYYEGSGKVCNRTLFGISL